jgi:hypothetical protein
VVGCVYAVMCMAGACVYMVCMLVCVGMPEKVIRIYTNAAYLRAYIRKACGIS